MSMRVPEDHWYPVLESREVGHKPLGVERLGQPLVFWRAADGVVHAHANRCPHLGAALSGGKVSNGRLVCPFHGFEFDAEGRCRHIPALGREGRIPSGMALRQFALREAHGFIWLWRGETREAYPDLPFFPQLGDGWRYGTVVVDWPAYYSRAIENQLDVAHLPFVHRSTIGGGGRSLVEGPHVEDDKNGIRVWVTNAPDDGRTPRSRGELAAAAAGKEPGLHFLFPGLWLLNISPKLKNFIAFVPINAQKTRYYLRIYHRHRAAIVAKPFEMLMGISNRFILEQDRKVVVTQTPADSSAAGDDRPIGADRAIVKFRQQLARLINNDDARS